jgi:hypothetical protein
LAFRFEVIFFKRSKTDFNEEKQFFLVKMYKIKDLAIIPDIEEKNTLGISVFFAIIFQRKEKLLLHLVNSNST